MDRKLTGSGPEIDRKWIENRIETVERQGIEFRQPETDFYVNVKYQEIFGITMSHRAKAGFSLANKTPTSDWLR